MVATAGLVLIIFALPGAGRGGATPAAAVDTSIGDACFVTSSTG